MEAEGYELFVQKVYQDLTKDAQIVVYHRKEYTRHSSGRPCRLFTGGAVRLGA